MSWIPFVVPTGAAAINMAAAVTVTVVGAAVLLYERFSVRSRKLALATTILGAVMLCYALTVLSTGGDAEMWYRIAVSLDGLLAPAVYTLAMDMVGKRRPRIIGLTWALGAAIFAWSLASPAIFVGLGDIQAMRIATPAALAAWVFLCFMTGTLAATVFELFASSRQAQFPEARRGALTVMMAVAVGMLGLIDFITPRLLLYDAGLTPLTVSVAALLFAFAATRFRSFAPLPSFAAERVLDVMADGVLLCDAAGRVRNANRAACRFLGEPEESLRSRVVTDIFCGLPREEAEAPADQDCGPPTFAPEETLRDREMRLLRGDGTMIDISLSSEPLHEGNEVVGSVIVFRDIRERLRAAREIRATEQRYQSLFWNNPSLAYEFDTTGHILQVNPALERLLGIPAAALQNRTFHDFIHPDDLPLAREVYTRVLEGMPEHYRLRLIMPDGALVEIKGVSVPVLRENVIVGVFGIALDITEEERVRRALELQRLEFTQLFEASPEAIIVADEDDVVVRLNPEFTRTFGYTGAQAIGRRIDDLLVPPDLRDEGTHLTQAARAGDIVRAETIRQRSDGTLIDVSVLARELRLPGMPPQLYGIYRDITEQKRAERSLRERDEQLLHAQRLESVGKLAGGIAHDFNNLVTVINGHVRFALDALPDDSPAREDLIQVELAGGRAANLTQQLLAFSRRQLLRPETVDAAAVIADVRQMLDRIIGEHIRFDTSHDGPALVCADRGQLEQMLVNLVVNARDAMPGGGTLHIATDRTHLPDDETEAAGWDAEPGEYVRIIVTDTGMGMDEETCARAFDPFFTTKEQGKGTGLGLATVFGIAKQSGGHVVAASRRGHGTTIRVWLPAATAPTAEEAAATAAHADVVGAQTACCHARRVLIAEDEVALRELTARILRRAGYDVLLAADGVEALAIAEREQLDLVVSDLVMPRMGGRELFRHLREAYPDLPIVLMSGYDDEIAGGVAPELMLSKPFTPAELVLRVQQALAAAHQH